jgi:L-ascorbate metabolism protein UlaG (beta-lactamase superfamily)
VFNVNKSLKLIIALTTFAIIAVMGCTTTDQLPAFKNAEARKPSSKSGVFWEWLTREQEHAEPSQPIPLRKINAEDLKETAESVVYRLGHSTVLIRTDGQYILTDPIFSERASPVQWIGPKRFHKPALAIDELPPIKAVIISHDHYDHLDKHSIQALADRVEYFLTPLRVGQYLRDWRVAADKIIELDWWQQKQVGSLTFIATPSQHFSGRGLFDRNKTLWASWVIQSQQANIYFSGDTGYFNGFKEIGERLGPFDITLMENGAYNPAWSDVHMMPEETVKAHQDLGGNAMVTIHNGTFKLALHDWFEPLERVQQLSDQQGVNLLTPLFGEAVNVTAPEPTFAWWRSYIPKVASASQDAQVKANTP